MDVTNYLTSLSEGCGGIWQENRTVEFLQYNWDRMRHFYDDVMPVAHKWIPSPIYNEFTIRDREPYMDVADQVLVALTLAYSAAQRFNGVNQPSWLNTDLTAEQADSVEKFMYYLRNWNAIMDAQWAAV